MNYKSYTKLSKLNLSQILNSKYLLYIIENIHYLKKDLNGFEIYRDDSQKLRKKLQKIMSKIKVNENF